jgi:hypothetical protein
MAGRTILQIGLVFLLAACGRVPPFCVEQFTQENASRVLLNEPLVIRFNREIDCSSITRTTLDLFDAFHRQARGSWVVQGKNLRFVPCLPREPDCTDTGLLPGGNYTVHLKGFPAFNALRSTKGTLLNHDYVFTFQTVTGDALSTEWFVDPKPGFGPCLELINDESFEPLNIKGMEVPAGSELKLTFSEPIFPGSVAGSRAKVYIIWEDTVDGEPLNLISRSIKEDPTGASLGVQPEGGFEAGRSYKLFRFYLDYTDFGGNPIEDNGFNFISIHCVKESAPQ